MDLGHVPFPLLSSAQTNKNKGVTSVQESGMTKSIHFGILYHQTRQGPEGYIFKHKCVHLMKQLQILLVYKIGCSARHCFILFLSNTDTLILILVLHSLQMSFIFS